jgi:Sulfotransferase family
MFPDFIGIGAQKAGTTWLHRNLQAHPEIYMPRKEVHYFDRKIKDRTNPVSRFFGKRDIDVQWRRQVKRTATQFLRRPSFKDLAWDFNYYMRPYNDRWYGSVFEPKNGKVAGEITPAYSALDRERVAHVHSLVPDAKIIFMMRNPIERAWSQTVMSFDKVEKGSFSSVSEEELFKKIGRNSTYKLSNYLRTFEHWEAFYPPERFFVGFLEDSSFLPRELLQKLYSFLGVDPDFEPPLTEKKIHSRSAGTMPTKVAVHLAKNFREEISRLEERFGGYASFWLYCADRLIEDPPDGEEMTYPLFESYLWEEWANGAGGSAGLGSRQVQSGPLSSIQVAT